MEMTPQQEYETLLKKRKNRFAKKDEVIELLKHGCEIYTWRNEVKGAKGQLVYSAKTWEISNCLDINRPVHHSTIVALMKAGIIMSEKPYSLIE